MYPETEQITAERMCYIVNDKDLSQQAKEYFAQIRKTDRLIHRLDSTIATLRSSLTSTGSQLKQDKVQTSGPKNTLEETITKIIDLEAKINARIDELEKGGANAVKVAIEKELSGLLERPAVCPVC